MSRRQVQYRQEQNATAHDIFSEKPLSLFVYNDHWSEKANKTAHTNSQDFLFAQKDDDCF